jgi:hypothetical protein
MEQIVVEVTHALDAKPLWPLAELCAPGAPCLDLWRVRLLWSFHSRDGRREILVFEAPDAEALRQIFATLGPALVDIRIWACA